MIYTNGGTRVFDQIGILKLLPIEVHYNGSSMANILAMKDIVVLPNVCVLMDSAMELAIKVEFDNKVYKFQQFKDGLYVCDLSSFSPSTKSTDPAKEYSYLQSVSNNLKYYTRTKIEGANNARTLQHEIGWPSTSTYKKIIGRNQIRNTNVTVDDINRAELIYGEAAPLIDGKMVRVHPPNVKIE